MFFLFTEQNWFFIVQSVLSLEKMFQSEHRDISLRLKVIKQLSCSFVTFSVLSGDLVTISDYTGDFEESRLLEAREVILIAAGTGEI